MDDRYRPVKLNRVVVSYPCRNGQSDFKFDYSLNYKLTSLVQNYSDRKPTLIVCSHSALNVFCPSTMFP